MNFLNDAAYMYVTSEFRAQYVCTNLNNVRANKGGSETCESRYRQFRIPMDHNAATVKKIITTQQIAVITESTIVFMGNAHYSKIYKISAEHLWVLNIISAGSHFPQQRFSVTV